MGTFKIVVLTVIAFSAGCLSAVGQSTLPMGPGSNEVVYRQSFTINSNFTEDDAYNMVQAWVNQSPEKFTAQNAEMPGETRPTKKVQEVEAAFENTRPLQSVDPSSKRIAARGLIKYYGGVNTCIHLLYIEYYLLVEINDHVLTATISKIKYHHFNSRTYAAQNIYNWQGGRPCDAANKIEHLVEVQTYPKEFDALCAYMNGTTSILLNDLKRFLKVKSALAANSEL